MWSKSQLTQHQEAAKKLVQIKNDIAHFFRDESAITEYQVVQAILDFFKIHGLYLDSHSPIVAFGKNTSHVHYFPEKKGSLTLKKNTLILVDIWARLNQPKAPYADFTWMFFYGDREPDPAYQEAFSYVAKARDLTFSYIRKILKAGDFPVGADCDATARNYLAGHDLGQYFLHTLGHSLGTRSPHGVYGGLRPRTKKPLVPMLGYTNEPGVYFANRFGIRSEVDFYITPEKKVEITLPLQKKIELIKA